jgi:hypothetical protein
MAAKKRTWGFVRWAYFLFGFVLLVVNLLTPGIPSIGYGSLFLVSGLLMGAAFFSGDELFQRIHRIVWRREWPK